MKKTILMLAVIAATLVANAQNTGMSPIGIYSAFGEEGDYWKGIKELVFSQHEFEYAYFEAPSLMKEKALLVGRESLTLVELDGVYWSWYYKAYLSENRKDTGRPNATALTVAVDKGTARDLLSLINFAASTAAYRNHERYVLDGVTYSFIPSSKYAPAAQTKNLVDSPAKQLIEILEKAAALVKEQNPSAIAALLPEIQACQENFQKFMGEK